MPYIRVQGLKTLELSLLKFIMDKITSLSAFQLSNVVLGEPKDIKSNNGTMYTIPISIKHSDGKKGKLLFSTGRIFCYGVSDGKEEFRRTDKLKMTLPLSMIDKDDPKPEQINLCKALDSIAFLLRQHVYDNRQKFKLGGCTLDGLLKNGATFLTYKLDKESGERKEGVDPVLYARLPCARDSATNMITWYSRVIDEYDRNIDPMKFFQRKCDADVIIHIKSVETYGGLKQMGVTVNVYLARLVSRRVDIPMLLEPSTAQPPAVEEEDDVDTTTPVSLLTAPPNTVFETEGEDSGIDDDEESEEEQQIVRPPTPIPVAPVSEPIRTSKTIKATKPRISRK